MEWRKGVLKASLLATTCLGLVTFNANAQGLLDQNLPNPNAGFGADFLRRGSGYGTQSDTINAAETAAGVTVLTRPHPEYDAQGVQYGKIRIDLSGYEGVGYDSNPLGLKSAKGSG